MRTVLFLCTGNYYRSRFAELRFNALAEARGLGWRAASAGLRVDFEQKWNKGPLSPSAVAALRARGMPLPEPLRMPRPICDADLAGADLVVCLQRSEHRPMVAEACPGWEDRVEYWEVNDVPPSEAYDPMAVIDAEVEALVGRLENG